MSLYATFLGDANNVVEGTTAEPNVNVEISGIRHYANGDVAALDRSITEPPENRVNADMNNDLEIAAPAATTTFTPGGGMGS